MTLCFVIAHNRVRTLFICGKTLSIFKQIHANISDNPRILDLFYDEYVEFQAMEDPTIQKNIEKIRIRIREITQEREFDQKR